RFTAWIFSVEENLAIKNAPPIVRLCLTIGVHFMIGDFFMQLRYTNALFIPALLPFTRLRKETSFG
ncbi:hypothetical protein U9K47_14205, partial [Bacillus toyonensis]|uniref:hypothetical protein n=1 Tax=Bacillus toyonensis TaxID=155322 RepID=UPI0034656731